jgi:hypothetical protein
MWWCDRQDTWDGSTNRDNTLKRWGGGSMAYDIMNDFKARLKWLETSGYSNGNHEPEPSVNGNNGYDVLYLQASAG